MNPYCDYCGARLDMDPMKCWGECPKCGETKALRLMEEEPRPELLHGIRCTVCDGEGYVEIEREERHPYGDGYASELLTEIETCQWCNGAGCAKDQDSCVVCGDQVADGWSLHGWEVHEGCHDEELPQGADRDQR